MVFLADHGMVRDGGIVQTGESYVGLWFAASTLGGTVRFFIGRPVHESKQLRLAHRGLAVGCRGVAKLGSQVFAEEIESKPGKMAIARASTVSSKCLAGLTGHQAVLCRPLIYDKCSIMIARRPSTG